ncbi:50S ribosomal protein L32 [Tautonia plasticadhaerens]|uniref:Large ribosomal subunit protein bL32 n=1 Tax=Tautonia plasticadhaerens TaxID=2527974 RepID=A0A518H558_9BACT|nr:50S ribosomal protein L32 [Tautonia plasticadhaerens]QDV35962.1 50S ribosomal protein L32 [Tautonia plasticadhaerens]
MAVPKRRTSKSKKGMRRSHDALQFTIVLIACDQCGSPKPRHTVCPECGTYRGRQVVKIGDEE